VLGGLAAGIKEREVKEMNIYEIQEEILECFDAETGEIFDIEKLEKLEMARDQKISNIACLIKNKKAEAEAIKAEKLALEKRQKTAENEVERLKGWLARILNGEKFADNRCSIGWRKSEKVVFAEGFDFGKLPEHMKKVTIEPRKTEIKDFLKAGGSLEGAKIEESNNIQIK
jgi:hypothetical protein